MAKRQRRKNKKYPKLDDQISAAAKCFLQESENTTIHILTDHDTDGLMAAFILYTGLKELGYDAELNIIPETQGHWIDKEWIVNDITINPGDKVITADIGAAQYEDLMPILDQGAILIMTDHHNDYYTDYQDIEEAIKDMTDKGRLIEANPSTTNGRKLDYCGATLARMLIEEIGRQQEKPMIKETNKEPNLDALKTFEAIAIIADRQDERINYAVTVGDLDNTRWKTKKTDQKMDTQTIRSALPKLNDMYKYGISPKMKDDDASLVVSRFGQLISKICEKEHVNPNTFSDEAEGMRAIRYNIAPIINNIKHMGKGQDDLIEFLTESEIDLDTTFDKIWSVEEERRQFEKTWINEHSKEDFVHRDDDFQYPGERMTLASQIANEKKSPAMIAGPLCALDNKQNNFALYTTTVFPEDYSIAQYNWDIAALRSTINQSHPGVQAGNALIQPIYGTKDEINNILKESRACLMASKSEYDIEKENQGAAKNKKFVSTDDIEDRPKTEIDIEY